MLITIKFFSIIRETIGINEAALEVPAQSSVADVAHRLALRYPSISTMLPRVAYAVNQSYVPTTTQLSEGDELAIIPPVSGG